MALVATDSFDFYNGAGTNTGLQARWTRSGATAASLVAGRFGGQALRMTPATVVETARRNLTAARASGGHGFAHRSISMPVNNLVTSGFHYALLNGTTYTLGLRVTTTGAIDVYRATANNAGTLLGSTAAGVIVVNTWHFIEWEYVVSDTVGRVTLKVDGVQVINLINQDTNNAVTTVNVFEVFASNNTGRIDTFDIDDWHEYDAASTPGERKLTAHRPTADTAQKDFTASSGSDNFAMVDDTTANGDTDFVQATTVGNQDLYPIDALSTTPAAIDGVTVVIFAEKTDANTRTLAASVDSAGTGSDGTAFALAASYGKFERLMTTDPNGGGAWTASRVNGLKIGPKVAS
jgi:hypothetical protein